MIDPFSVRDRVILVTGGTRGLGRAISVQLASCGAEVVAGYFQNDQTAASFLQDCRAKEYRCHAVRANLLTAVGIQALVDFIAERYSRLDAMVYNSATGVHRPLDSLSTRHLSTVWQLNVGSFFELAIKLKPLMSRGSRIIALSSEGARRAVTRYGAVGSSKAALEALCRQMAAEWAGIGISVNVVAPGLLETESLAAMENADDRVKREIIANPLARLVRLEEVALATHFLCAPASEGIIGQTIVMDGGKSISGL